MRLNNKKGVNNGFAPGVLRFDVSAERTPSFTTWVPVAMVINTATYGNDGSLKSYWHGTNNHHHNPYGICATRASWSGGDRKPKNSCIYPRHNWLYCVVFSLFGSVDAGCQYNLPKQVHNALSDIGSYFDRPDIIWVAAFVKSHWMVFAWRLLYITWFRRRRSPVGLSRRSVGNGGLFP